jgi:transposase
MNLLWLTKGKAPAEIADFLGFSVNKVFYWCAQVEPENLKSLRNGKMKENPKKATDKYIEILL